MPCFDLQDAPTALRPQQGKAWKLIGGSFYHVNDEGGATSSLLLALEGASLFVRILGSTFSDSVSGQYEVTQANLLPELYVTPEYFIQYLGTANDIGQLCSLLVLEWDNVPVSQNIEKKQQNIKVTIPQPLLVHEVGKRQ